MDGAVREICKIVKNWDSVSKICEEQFNNIPPDIIEYILIYVQHYDGNKLEKHLYDNCIFYYTYNNRGPTNSDRISLSLCVKLTKWDRKFFKKILYNSRLIDFLKSVYSLQILSLFEKTSKFMGEFVAKNAKVVEELKNFLEPN